MAEHFEMLAYTPGYSTYTQSTQSVRKSAREVFRPSFACNAQLSIHVVLTTVQLKSRLHSVNCSDSCEPWDELSCVASSQRFCAWGCLRWHQQPAALHACSGHAC